MFHAKIKRFRKSIKKWWRQRQDLTSKVNRLQSEIDDLRLRLEVTSAFYERRLDAALAAMADFADDKQLNEPLISQGISKGLQQ